MPILAVWQNPADFISGLVELVMKKALCVLAAFSLCINSPATVMAQQINGPTPPLSKIRVGDIVIWPGASTSNLFYLELLEIIDDDNVAMVPVSRRNTSQSGNNNNNAVIPGRPIRGKPFIFQAPGIGLGVFFGVKYYIVPPTLCTRFINYDHPQGGIIRVFVIIPAP